MANKTIGQLTAKTTPASADVFALEDTEDTKKINYDALADAILNKITSKNYTVAGSSQTLINAINTLNSNGLYDRGGLRGNVDLNDLKTPGLYYCDKNSGSNFPTGLSYNGVLIEVSLFANSGGVCQVCIDAVGTSKRIWRRYFVNSAWSDWVQQPERQEITDLNSNHKILELGWTTDLNISNRVKNTVSHFTFLQTAEHNPWATAVGHGYLFVNVDNENYGFMFVCGNNGMCARKLSSGTYNSWVTLM